MSLLFRQYAARGGVPAPGLGITMPGAAFLIDDRSGRDGNAAGTLASQFFAIPGSGLGVDRIFYFTQADADGVQRGFFPADAYPALSAYAATAIPLPNGAMTSEMVAIVAAFVLSGFYPSVTITGGNRVDVLGDIDPGGASAGVDWAARGDAGAWGMQRADGGNTDFELEAATTTFGVGPTFTGTGYLRAADVYLGPGVAALPRVGVYVGGGFRAPAASSLLADLGQVSVTAGPNGWARVYAGGDIVFPSAANLQVVVKAPANSNTRVGFGIGGANIGDYTGGLFNSTAALGDDPTAPYPDVFPGGGNNVGDGFVAGVRLLYEQTPIAAAGDWRRRWGVHVPAADMLTPATFIGTALCGGGLPPNVHGMRVSSVDVLAQDDASMRLGVYQGGSVEQPGGAVVIWDAGRGPAGPGLPVGRYGINAPPGIAVDPAQAIWWATHTDGGQGPYRYATSGGGAQQANPQTNPMDWPQNTGIGDRPEFDQALPEDPDTPFDDPFVVTTGGYDGNYPPAAIDFVVDGFGFTVL